MPAFDVSGTDKAYEITAEVPGMDEKNIELKLANGVLHFAAKRIDTSQQFCR